MPTRHKGYSLGKVNKPCASFLSRAWGVYLGIFWVGPKNARWEKLGPSPARPEKSPTGKTRPVPKKARREKLGPSPARPDRFFAYFGPSPARGPKNPDILQAGPIFH